MDVAVSGRRLVADAVPAARFEDAYAPVFRALVAMGATPDDAADAVQDALEDAVRQRVRAERPDAWLFVVARRHWRRGRWRQRIFRPIDALRGHARADREPEIDLLVALRGLTERQRTVVVARYVLGLSQRETADLLGIAVGTVAATAYQVTAILRERLLGGEK